jgi:peptidoglycan/xylan/chitin deacetylase (PgdA/CDA1 family)
MLLAALLAAAVVKLPILEYHRIGPLTPALPAITRRLTVDPASFAAQMEWLKRHRFHAVTDVQAYDAMERGAALPPRPVMITFDDGYRDVLWNAAPVLHRLGLPATAFVITDRVDGRDPSFLTWGELRRLERLGVAIGSHTVSHADLAALAPGAALAQLVRSRRTLQEHLHRPVDWLSYPFGRFDAAVAALARRAGYELGVTEAPGDVQSAPLELRRDEVLDTTGVAGVAGFLGG